MLAFIAGRRTRDKEDAINRVSFQEASFAPGAGKKRPVRTGPTIYQCGVRDGDAILSPPFYLKVSSLSRLARYTTADAMDAFA